MRNEVERPDRIPEVFWRRRAQHDGLLLGHINDRRHDPVA
jgi:hypothetical protein